MKIASLSTRLDPRLDPFLKFFAKKRRSLLLRIIFQNQIKKRHLGKSGNIRTGPENIPRKSEIVVQDETQLDIFAQQDM